MPNVCLHVTNAAAIQAICEQGLIAQIGPLSSQIETHAGVFLFPSWDDMMDANWLFDEAWPHASEPALLCVNTEGLDLEDEAGYELVSRESISPNRITVLAPNELDWRAAKSRFLALGGRIDSAWRPCAVPQRSSE